MFAKVIGAVLAGRWLTLVFWILLTAGLVQVAPNLEEEANTSQQAARASSSAEAVKAGELIAAKFPDVREAMNNRVTVTLYRPGGLTAADEAYGKDLERYLTARKDAIRLKAVTSPFTAPQAAAALLSRDRQAALLALDLNLEYQNTDSNAWLAQTTEVIPRIRGYLTAGAAVPAGLEVHLTGNNAIWGDVITLQEESLARTMLMTLVFILVVLLIIYRSPIAAVFPLLSVLIALTVSQAVLGFAADAGLSVSPNALVFLIVVLFGLGTDHSLLIFSRFRENLLAGKEKAEALRIAVANGGAAIFASVCTVVVAFGVMGFVQSWSFRAIGQPLAIAVAIEFVVIMTLIPAFLALLGEKVFWPFLPSKARARAVVAQPGIWARVAGSVTRRPVRYIVVTVVALLPFIALLAGFKLDNNELRALLPTSTDSYKGLTVVREHFGEAAAAEDAVPIVLTGTGAASWDLQSLRGNLERVPGVRQVTGGTGPQSVSTDGTSVILSVTLRDDPYSDDALAAVGDIRDSVRSSLSDPSLNGVTAYVGGVTAEVKDNLDTQTVDFVFIIVAVLLGIFVILALLLRSLVAPLYMVGTIVFAFAATMGITFAFFTYVLGYPGLWFDAPVVSFVVLVALGIDYSIFLMTRVREEYVTHHRPNTTAVRNALAGTGSVITSCGIILAGTFIPFVFSGIKTFVEMGFAIVVGLLLDTFVIRTLLVPAIATAVGDRNWWPSRRRPAPAPALPAQRRAEPAVKDMEDVS